MAEADPVRRPGVVVSHWSRVNGRLLAPCSPCRTATSWWMVMFPCSKASHALRGRAATCVLGIGDESLRLLPCGEWRVAEDVPDGRRAVRVIMKVRYAQYTTGTPGRVLTAPLLGSGDDRPGRPGCAGRVLTTASAVAGCSSRARGLTVSVRRCPQIPRPTETTRSRGSSEDVRNCVLTQGS